MGERETVKAGFWVNRDGVTNSLQRKLLTEQPAIYHLRSLFTSFVPLRIRRPD